MEVCVCSIVVTFNRKDLLVKNIDAILNQSYKSDILIIDNSSTDGTENLLRDKYDFNKLNIIYHNTKVNIGGSGGFYTGLKLAFDAGKYDYFWLMDDDGRPLESNCLQLLIEAIPCFNNIDILNSLVVSDDKHTLSFGLSNFQFRDQVKEKFVIGFNNPFNGTLIPYSLVKLIGFPHKEFFIGYDEVEYMARCQKSGGNLITVSNSIYYHPQPLMNTYKFLGKTIISIEGTWKEYYRLRNFIFFIKEYYGYFRAINISFRKIIGAFIFSRNGRIRKAYVTLRACIDGFNGDFSVDDFHIIKEYRRKGKK